MATDIAITSTTRVTSDDVVAVLEQSAPDCACVEFLDGDLWLVVDAAGTRVLSVFASKQIEDSTAATELIGHPVDSGGWWTLGSAPIGQQDRGVALMRSLAAIVDGEAAQIS